MCKQCDELQKQISHYRAFLKQGFDPLTEGRIKEVICELEQRKAAVH
jgi:hypothetical protein